MNPINRSFSLKVQDRVQLGTLLNYNNTPLITKSINPTIFSQVNNIPASWSAVDGIVDAETSTIYDEVNKVNRSNCVKLTSTNRGRFIASLDKATNLNLYGFRISFYVDPLNTLTDLGSCDIEFYSGGKTTSTYRASFRLIYGETNTAYNPQYYWKKWHHVVVNALPKLGATGASFDATNVTAIGFKPIDKASTSLVYYIADVSFIETMLQPGVITIVDNFDVSVPAMCDYAYSKGVKLNISIIPNSLLGGSAFVSASLDELKRIAKQGHLVFNHTFNHITPTTLTESEILAEYTNARDWMLANGFRRGAKLLSNPTASYNSEVHSALMGTDLVSLYHHWVLAGLENENINYPFYPSTRLLNITSLDEYEKAVVAATRAITYKGIAVNGYHGTFWSADNGVKFKAYIDEISAIAGIKHYGIDDLVEGKFT